MTHRFTSRVVVVVASVLCAGWTLAALPQGPTEVPEEVTSVAAVTDESLGAEPVTDDPFAESVECAELEPLDFTPDVPPDASSTGAARASDAAANCRKCQDRPWCKCSNNGLPRVSCNPCCYGNLGIPQVCLD